MGSCLGGTVEGPKRWWRLTADGYIQLEGRICDRTTPRTDPAGCWPCVAYRGKAQVPYGSRKAGRSFEHSKPYFDPRGDPYAMTDAEHAEYEDALEATYDDDFTRLGWVLDRIAARVHGGQPVSERALRWIGDPDALERHATRVMEWREAHPEATREIGRKAAAKWRARNRERYNTYQRELMRRRRAAGGQSGG